MCLSCRKADAREIIFICASHQFLQALGSKPTSLLDGWSSPPIRMSEACLSLFSFGPDCITSFFFCAFTMRSCLLSCCASFYAVGVFSGPAIEGRRVFYSVRFIKYTIDCLSVFASSILISIRSVLTLCALSLPFCLTPLPSSLSPSLSPALPLSFVCVAPLSVSFSL